MVATDSAWPALPTVRPYLDLLRSYHADETPHSGRHLIDHLIATHDLLAQWGNPPDVCRAGLFHSIYGTNIFTLQSASLGDRDRLRAAIGPVAERLAYLFCVIDRPIALLKAALMQDYVLEDRHQNTQITITPDELAQLIEIEVANFLEAPEDVETIRQINLILDRFAPPIIRAETRAALKAYLAA
ncbi:MAG: DUF6817 domain-containing protein [Aliidongia sp.]